MKERIDYEGMIATANILETSSAKLEEIFKQIYTKIQEINQEDVWKSPASLTLKEKFNKSYANFNKYHLEITSNAMYLKQKVSNYKDITKTSINTLNTTTSNFLNKVNRG